jgi:dihydrofolate synthase / folylpolyglutamate synthase
VSLWRLFRTIDFQLNCDFCGLVPERVNAMPLMNFAETIQYLFSLGHETVAIKLGLRNTELLLESLGHPHKSYEAVQIAGTNGKGSTAVVLESICRAVGIKTGLFTSPHLVSITERIRIDGTQISQDNFAKYASVVRAAAENLVAEGKLESLPTFFEHVTAIALLAFKDNGVTLAILETGLGGRLDATTVAGAMTIAITPLALDHQQYLGETLEEIAYEKASIIHHGAAAIIGPQPAPALDVILRHCAEVNVKPNVDRSRTRIETATSDGRFQVTFETTEDRYESVLLGLRGRHQIVNVAVALRLAEALRRRGFEITKAAIKAGIEAANHSGRLELHEGHPSLLLDGAHNPSGAQALKNYLDEFVNRPLTLIFSAMNDKKLGEMAAILFPAADSLVLTQPENPRAAGTEDLQRLATGIVEHQKVFAAASVTDAFLKAKQITPSNGLICVTGSLYLVGEIKALVNTLALSKASP